MDRERRERGVIEGIWKVGNRGKRVSRHDLAMAINLRLPELNLGSKKKS